jgi:hypothetical protein
LKGFSQKDIQTDSIVRINSNIAKLVVKDLTLFDSNSKKLKTLELLNQTYREKIQVQTTIITNLETQVTNLNGIVDLQERQISSYDEINYNLSLQLKKQRIKSKILSYGGGLITLSLIGIILIGQ